MKISEIVFIKVVFLNCFCFTFLFGAEVVEVSEADKIKAEEFYNSGKAREQSRTKGCIIDYEEGIKCFDQAIALDSKNTKYIYARAEAYKVIAFSLWRKYDKKIRDYNSNLSDFFVKDDRFTGEVLLGLLNDQHAIISDNYRKAVENYTKIIELSPNSKEVYFMRAELYAYLKEYDKALADYSKVIELDVNYLKSYLLRAKQYVSLKEYDKALLDYNQAIALSNVMTEQLN